MCFSFLLATLEVHDNIGFNIPTLVSYFPETGKKLLMIIILLLLFLPLFQVVDDILDFISTDMEMGKPTATDLQLGLATAPVLFACEQVKGNVMVVL